MRFRFRKLKVEIAEFKRSGYINTDTVKKLTEEVMKNGGAIYFTGCKRGYMEDSYVRFSESYVWVQNDRAYLNYTCGTDVMKFDEEFEEDEAMYEGETPYDRASDWVYSAIKECIEYPERLSLVLF